MRALIDAVAVRAFMRQLGAAAEDEGRVYFSGGATAVLAGWRTRAIDLDLKLVPARIGLVEAVHRIADSLGVNVDLTCPADYLPELPGWEERSPLVGREGRVAFHHYDLAAQALAKIERGHTQDLLDVQELLGRGLVTPLGLREHFGRLEALLERFPAVHPASFREALEELLDSLGRG